ERPDADGDPVAGRCVVEDAPGDLCVRGAELDRVEAGVARHRSDGAERAVAAVRAKLEKAARLHLPDRRIEDLALLVADVDHEALAVAEVVDRPDRSVDVTGPRARDDVLAEGRLATISYLPVPKQVLHAERHPPERPAQEREALAADLGHPRHAR